MMDIPFWALIALFLGGLLGISLVMAILFIVIRLAVRPSKENR